MAVVVALQPHCCTECRDLKIKSRILAYLEASTPITNQNSKVTQQISFHVARH